MSLPMQQKLVETLMVELIKTITAGFLKLFIIFDTLKLCKILIAMLVVYMHLYATFIVFGTDIFIIKQNINANLIFSQFKTRNINSLFPYLYQVNHCSHCFQCKKKGYNKHKTSCAWWLAKIWEAIYPTSIHKYEQNKVLTFTIC